MAISPQSSFLELDSLYPATAMLPPPLKPKYRCLKATLLSYFFRSSLRSFLCPPPPPSGTTSKFNLPTHSGIFRAAPVVPPTSCFLSAAPDPQYFTFPSGYVSRTPRFALVFSHLSRPLNSNMQFPRPNCARLQHCCPRRDPHLLSFLRNQGFGHFFDFQPYNFRPTFSAFLQLVSSGTLLPLTHESTFLDGILWCLFF